jgi:PAS domain S-box-containing protein
MDHMLTRQKNIDRQQGASLSLQFLQWFPLLLFFLFLGIPCAQADNPVVKVGVYENEPKVFTSEDGRPSGIFIDIIEFIAKREGWNLKYVSGTWAEGLNRLARGEIDLMPDVAYTSDREKIYSFHKIPVLSAWSQVYALKGSNIQSILDLNGKRIAALEHTIQMETFARLTNSFGLKITLIPVPDYKTEFEMIAKGKVDAGITNRFYGLIHARKFGLEDTPVMFDPAPFFFAALKNNPKHLLGSIDSHISALKKDTHSVYYASLKRWTSEEVRYTLPAWLQIFGLAAGIILLVSIGGSIVLKRQVNARTQELSKSEKKYRDIFENAVIGVYQSTPAGRFQSANPAFAKLFGYETPEELMENIKDSQHDVYVNPEDRLRFKKLMTEEGEVKGFQAEFKRRDGSHFWISISGKAIHDDQGRILHYEGTFEDITTRKKAENELAIYKDYLEELVKERTAQLEAAREKAESADRIKSAFLAAMSHELRTPLNSIIGFTGMVLQGLAGPLNDEQKKQLGMVRGSARHLLDLINDILDISKIEAGQLQITSENFDLRKSIEKAVQIILPLAEKKNLQLHFKIGDDISEMRGDQRRVEQILINLLSNAVKFTDEGAINLHCHKDNNSIILSVADTGIGIKPENLNIIFDAFRQVDSGITRVQEGTGLGLNITKKLVEMMGGYIHVESKWGKGSTFTVIFPKIKE